MLTVVDGVLEVDGDVGLADAGSLELAGLKEIAAGNCVTDWSRVSRANSAGLAVLLSWVRAARARGVVLKVRHLPPSLAELAALYGVAALIDPSAAT